ncbi:MAG: sulfate ABC transporter substrate-binding protein [Gaiellaceae bacterium]
MRRISLTLLLALAFPALAAGASRDTKLALVAYSTPRDAYGQLISAFQKTGAGKGVSFSQSYGASGEQSRAVASGLGADIVAFSLAPDITSLVQKKLVAESWNKDAFKGMVTRSVVVFVVRDGNPKKIKTWADLLKPGVQIVTPNPFTSGGARWNVMAAYGGALRAGKTPKQAQTYLARMWKHVVAQPASAREGLQTFLAGRGDVFLAYENEALFARQHGQNVQFVIPKATILIENPIAVTTTSQHKAAARAFVNFLRTKPAQRLFAQNGYRPVVKGVTQRLSFPNRPQLFTIKYVGGWAQVEKKFFDSRTGVMAKIIGSSGG